MKDEEQLVSQVSDRSDFPSLIDGDDTMRSIDLTAQGISRMIDKEKDYYREKYHDFPDFNCEYVPFIFLFEGWRLGKNFLMDFYYGYKEIFTNNDSLSICTYYILLAILCANEAINKGVQLSKFQTFFDEVTSGILDVEDSNYYFFYKNLYAKYQTALISSFPEIYESCKANLESENCSVVGLLTIIRGKLQAIVDTDSMPGRPAPLFYSNLINNSEPH